LEIDPVIGADEVTLDLTLTLEFHTEEPGWQALRPGGDAAAMERGGLQPRFRMQIIRFAEEMQSGERRLIASWHPGSDTPAGGSDSRLLVFLHAAVGFSLSPPVP